MPDPFKPKKKNPRKGQINLRAESNASIERLRGAGPSKFGSVKISENPGGKPVGYEDRAGKIVSRLKVRATNRERAENAGFKPYDKKTGLKPGEAGRLKNIDYDTGKVKDAGVTVGKIDLRAPQKATIKRERGAPIAKPSPEPSKIPSKGVGRPLPIRPVIPSRVNPDTKLSGGGSGYSGALLTHKIGESILSRWLSTKSFKEIFSVDASLNPDYERQSDGSFLYQEGKRKGKKRRPCPVESNHASDGSSCGGRAASVKGKTPFYESRRPRRNSGEAINAISGPKNKLRFPRISKSIR